MKDKAAIVIAALMITSMAVSFSTTTVSATHTRTAEISIIRVKGTGVTYPGVDNVIIVNALGDNDLAPYAITDNIWEENAAGIQITENNLWAEVYKENIKVEGASYDSIRDRALAIGAVLPWENSAADNIWAFANAENAYAEAIQTLIMGVFNPVPSDNIVENATLLKTAATNAKAYADNAIATGQFIKTKALEIYGIATDISKPFIQANATAENHAADNMIASATVVKGACDNIIAQANLIITAATAFPGPVLTITNSGPAGIIKVALTRPTASWTLDNIVGGWPAGWTENANGEALGSENRIWSAAAENAITIGTSETFQFQVKVPTLTTATEETHDFIIMTEDTTGMRTYSTFRMVVDNLAPTVTVATSPVTAKAGNVTITVTAGEPLSKMDKVTVQQKGTTVDNTTVTMSPNATRDVWTGTYSVIPATATANYDNTATVTVKAAYTVDTVGIYMAADATGTFWVDTIAPIVPDLATCGLTTLPENDNQPSRLITGTAYDNIGVGVNPTAEANMTVTIRVDNTTYTVLSGSDNKFSQAVLLNEGTNTVGVKFTDNAGNVGAENVQTITIDTVKPTITLTSIGGVSAANLATVPTKDSTPSIVLTITDATLGVRNLGYVAAKKGGYTVQLRSADNATIITTMVNSAAYTNKNSISFENTYTTALADNWYNVNIAAGDNFQDDNVYFRFQVDATAPTVTAPGAENPLLNKTIINPYEQRSTTLTLTGTGAPADAVTVNAYLNDATTAAATATIRSDLGWTISIPLTEGTTTKVELTMTDVAGNEGAKRLYGYVWADATAPVVILDDLPETTDAASLTISGRVTMNTWESYSDITLTVQVGTYATIPFEVPLNEDNTYTYSLALSLGWNTIIVKATDPALNVSVPKVAVINRIQTVDTTPPTVTITAPATSTETEEASIVVTGTSSESGTWTIVASSGMLTGATDSAGNFTVPVPLVEGWNTIVVSAKDAASNSSAVKSIEVKRVIPEVPVDTTAPTVTISKVEAAGVTLTSPYSTDQATVLVTGAVTKDETESYSDITVKVQGGGLTSTVETTPSATGSFSVSVVLVEGSNAITVQAVDQASNTSTATATITRTVTPWATYAIVIVIITLVLAAIAIFRKR